LSNEDKQLLKDFISAKEGGTQDLLKPTTSSALQPTTSGGSILDVETEKGTNTKDPTTGGESSSSSSGATKTIRFDEPLTK
jgi:hypothetical protein